MVLSSWLYNLFLSDGVAHSILILAIVITVGILLGKLKVKGIGLGATWVLFAGLTFAHFGMSINPVMLSFAKDFGLILFVYAIGLSVGPNFFSSFKKGGLALNMWAALIVLLACLCAYIIHLVTGTSLITMVGVMQGAVTNTPGLGAAEQTVSDILASGTVAPEAAESFRAAGNSLGLGYAVAYPLGVIGIIGSMLILKVLFKVSYASEEKKLDDESGAEIDSPEIFSVEILPGSVMDGVAIKDLRSVYKHHIIISRIAKTDGKVIIPSSEGVLKAGYKARMVTSKKYMEEVIPLFGKKISGMGDHEWGTLEKQLVSKRILVTKAQVNGRSLGELNVRRDYGVSITRILRAGIAIVPKRSTDIFVGDTLVAVGDREGVENLSELLGNTPKNLHKPQLAFIFLGIACGVLLGSVPIKIPGIPQTIKLGLAGGPLIVAILFGYFGHKSHFAMYTTQSANLMLRELGISIFLAAVGLGAGGDFVETLVSGGYKYVGYGVIITIVPLMIIGIIAKLCTKLNFLTLMGIVAGSTTDPPALAFSGDVTGSSYPLISYATVYPLSMFLRVLMAQIMVLIAMS